MTPKDKVKDNLIDELKNKTKELKKDIYVHEKVQEKLVNVKKEWEKMFDAIPDLIIIVDKDYRIVKANNKLAEKLGVKRDDLTGKFCYNVIHGTEEPPSYCPHSKSLSSGKEFLDVVHETKLNGYYFFSSTPLYNDKGELTGILEIARDISQQKLAENGLKQSEARAKAISESSIDAIVVIDGKGVITYFNPAAEKIFGYKKEEAEGRELHSFLVSEYARNKYYQKLPEFENTGQCEVIGKTLEVTAIRKDGTRFPVELSISSFKLDGQWYSAGAIRDITERKQMEEKLLTVSITDDLTGVFNRRGFFNFAERQIDISKRSKRTLSLAFLDINNMKEINDSFGHKTGDQALTDMADILRKTFRSSDIVARVGGDEFTVLIIEPRCPHIEDIINKKIENALKFHNEKMKRPYHLSVSIGFAHFDPDKPCSIDDLLARSDALMYNDKQKHKS